MKKKVSNFKKFSAQVILIIIFGLVYLLPFYRGEKNILYVISGLCKEIPEEATVLASIKMTDGSQAFIVLELK